MSDQTKQALLLIADISGYTRFMLAHRTAQRHSQVIISEIMGEILDHIAPALEVSKLEGDAVFTYAIKPDGDENWFAKCRDIGLCVHGLFEKFLDKIATLQGSAACKCSACTNIEQLRLKVVAHVGEAVFHQLGKFEELHGVDVIIVHRLLKNSVDSNQYILLTNEAHTALEFPSEIPFAPHRESYDDVGVIEAHLHDFGCPSGHLKKTMEEQGPSTTSAKIGSELRLFVKGALRSIGLVKSVRVRCDDER